MLPAVNGMNITEEWSFARAAIAFGFGGIGSVFGKTILTSVLFEVGFSFIEELIDIVLDCRNYCLLKRAFSL